jgi:hypothetical protein
MRAQPGVSEQRSMGAQPGVSEQRSMGAQPGVSEQRSMPAQPGVSEQRSIPTPVPGVQEYRNGTGGPQYERYLGPQQTAPPPSGTSYRQVVPQAPNQSRPVPAPAPPKVRLDRIVVAPQAQLEGQVVSSDRAPRPGIQLTFVAASQQGPHRSVTANDAGQFRVVLASGEWLVYVRGNDGKETFHRKLDLRDGETRPVTLVSD